MERKLTTILAAADEGNTLEPLKQQRSLIEEYGGSKFGSAGYSLIAQLESPVRATESTAQYLKLQK